MKVVNTEAASIPDLSGENVRVLAVLTQDDSGLYAVYIGIKRDDPARRKQHAEDVAHRGLKLSLEKAKQYFPTLDSKQYRA